MPTTNYGWNTPALGSENNVPADMASLAQQIDTTTKALDTKLTGSWTTYTPSWTDGTTSLALGTGGSIVGRWKDFGGTCAFQIVLTRGTGANIGAGAWVFGLPVSAGYGFRFVQGAGTITGNGKNLPVTVVGVGAGMVGLICPTGRVSNDVPGSWGTEIVAFGGLIEKAP